MTTPIQPDQYETWEAMILSDQVPADELARLLEGNPGFAEWHRKRAESRTWGSGGGGSGSDPYGATYWTGGKTPKESGQ